MPSVMPEMTSHESKELPLDANQITYTLRALSNLRQGLVLLNNDIVAVEKGAAKTIDSSIVHAVMSNCMATAETVSKRLGVPMHEDSEVANLRRALGKANTQIEKLEQQIGRNAAKEDFALGYKRTVALVRAWWQHEGLGWATDFDLSDNGLVSFKLNCRPSTLHSMFSESPEDEMAEHLALLQTWKDAGAVMLIKGSGKDAQVIDCVESRNAIFTMILATLPSAKLHGVTSRQALRGEVELLKELNPELKLGPVTLVISEIKVTVTKTSELVAIENKDFAKKIDFTNY